MFPVFMFRLSSYLVIKTAQAYIGGGGDLGFCGLMEYIKRVPVLYWRGGGDLGFYGRL